jgi:hypothetical protein
MRNRDVEKSYRKLYFSLDILYGMLPPTRKSNTKYCKRNEDSFFEHTTNSDRRYQAINPVAYSKFKTLEIRCHSGTVNSRKINNWIDILTKIVDTDVTLGRTIKKRESFYEKFGISEDLQKYIEERTAKFEGDVDSARVPNSKIDHSLEPYEETSAA